MSAIRQAACWVVAVGAIWGSCSAAEAADGGGFQVRVRETRGLERTNELVRLPLKAEAGPWRVTAADGRSAPAQIVETENGRALWFAADVPAKGERVYSVQPGTPAGPDYPIVVAGLTCRDQETYVRNRFYTATLMPRSAALNTLIAAGDPRWMLYNELRYIGCKEQLGPIHWTPDVLSLARTPEIPGRNPKLKGFWPKSFQWSSVPGLQESRGPLLYRIRRRGPVYFFNEVEAEVVYRFAAVRPEVIVESTIRMTQDLPTRILRNGEWVFRKQLFTRGACKDMEGTIRHFSLEAKTREAQKRSLHPEDPWLAVYDPEAGTGFAVVRLEIRNTGPDAGEPTLANYRMAVVCYGNTLEIARILVGLPGGQRDPEHQVVVKAGNVYFMREAILMFDARQKDALERLDGKAERLRHPLAVERVAAAE